MNKKFLTLVVIGTVVSVLTYGLLNHFRPYNKEVLKAAETVSVDEVFSGSLEPPAATEESSAATVEEVAAEIPAEQSAPDQATVEAEPAAAEEVAVAEEPAVVEPKSEPTAAIAQEKPAVESAKPASSPPTPAPKKVEKPAAAAPPAEITQWWGKEDPASLSLSHAGPASFQKALVLIFNGEFESAADADSNIQVLDNANKLVAGNWTVAKKNKKMISFAVNNVGRYTVIIKSTLKDAQGRTLAKDLRGPILVQ